MTTFILAATVYKSIGIVIAVLTILGFIAYAVINIFVLARKEVGSEIELAANRKPYLDDQELETRRLDRALGVGLATLAVIGIGLPLYWLAEPARMERSAAGFDRKAASRGETIYTTTAQCVNCHGPKGVGGVKDYTILDEQSGAFVAKVNWQAPALNTVLLRYTKDEVRFILEYGRPYSPMPAWGLEGGGPLTEQQLGNVIEYLESIQLTYLQSQAAAMDELEKVLGHEPDFISERGRLEAGEQLFNLGRSDSFAGGAYSCGRCHTQGWSYSSDPNAPKDRIDYPDGSGARGPNLTNGDTLRQFPLEQTQIDFVSLGSELGKIYGRSGQGTGVMPGFGDNPSTDIEYDGMMTPDMIKAVVEYERSLTD